MKKLILACAALAVYTIASAAHAQSAYDTRLLYLAQHLASVDGGCVRDGEDSVCLVASESASTLTGDFGFTHYSPSRDAGGDYREYRCRAVVTYVIGRLTEAPRITLDYGSAHATDAVKAEMESRPAFLQTAATSRMASFFRFIPMGRSQFV